MRRGKVINKASNFPEPFEGVEDMRHARLKSSVAEFRRVHGFDLEQYVEPLKMAYEDVREGSSIEAAVMGRTGIPWAVWANLSPELAAQFQAAKSEAGIDAEKRIFAEKPDVWARQMFPDRWTPNEKRETKHSGEVAVKAEMDAEMIHLASRLLSEDKQISG